MTTFDVRTHSLRVVRLRALAPRLLLYALVLILSLAGLRAILAPRPTASPPVRVVSTGPDFAAMTFAQSFARAYLSWQASNPEARQQALAPFLSESMDVDAGLAPADGTSQSVDWTTIAGETAANRTVNVTVAAHTNHGLVYLNVPVVRDSSGSLGINAYPAVVGPPPTNTSQAPPAQNAVEDTSLTTVVQRAITNYLAGEGTNLAADLTPGAVVSVPEQALHLQQIGEIDWSQQGSEVSAQVTASDSQGDAWTLEYQIGVAQMNGRWYVRSIQVNPTSEGGT